jgi:hypothetical protein
MTTMGASGKIWPLASACVCTGWKAGATDFEFLVFSRRFFLYHLDIKK